MNADAPPVPAAATIRRPPKPPKPRKKIGRRPKAVACERCGQALASAGDRRAHVHECPNPPKMGRPARKPPGVAAEAVAPANGEAKREAPAPAEHSRGYNKIFINESGELLETPVTEETEVTRRHQPKTPSAPVAPSVEIVLPGDVEMRKLCDEYGELDRRMQIRAPDVQRYETLKRAIKSWFDGAPPDADGSIEGEVYLLHLSARERERRIRDMRELVEAVGLDLVLDLATVALGALEDRIGRTRVEALAVEARTGSRRIKAVPKHPSGVQ